MTADPTYAPFTVLRPGSHYALAVFVPGAQKTRIIYKQPIAAWGHKMAGRKSWTFSMESSISRFTAMICILFRSARPRIASCSPLSSPILICKNAKILIPPGASVIEEATAAADALYMRTADAGAGKVLRIEYGNPTIRAVPQPEFTSAWRLNADPRIPGAVIGMGSWFQRDATYVYDPAAGRPPTHISNQKAADIRGLQVSDVRVRSHDGTLVPLTIISKAGLPRDSRNPTLLTGYGAYGISIDPNFNALTQPWIERGGIYAVAHVRGGGEYGEEWHAAENAGMPVDLSERQPGRVSSWQQHE